MSNSSQPDDPFERASSEANPFGDVNPYQASTVSGPAGKPTALSDVGVGMINHLPVLGVLMIVQGVLNSVMGLLMMSWLVFMPSVMQQVDRQSQQAGGEGMPESVMMFTSAFAGISVLFILLSIGLAVAGVLVMRFRNRGLAIALLLCSLGSVFTCYCFPTSLALAIYGLIVLLDDAVRVAFAMRKAGASAQSIQDAVSMLR